MRQVNNIDELRMAQMELQHKIEIKEMELKSHTNAIKEMLNPMRYINMAISRISVVEQLAASLVKGYETIRQLVAKYRHKEGQAEDIGENQ